MKKRGFTAEDVWNYRGIADIQATPDGKLCACAVKTPNRDEDSYDHAVWAVPLDGGDPFPLTTQRAGSDTHPRWKPDGNTLAFLSDREGGKQVFLMPRHGGEAQQLTHTKHQISAFEWSPDGRDILATMAIEVDSADRGETGGKPGKSSPEVAWRVPYKMDGMGFTLNEQTHLFRIDAETGEEKQVTRGRFEVREGVFSPDGKRIVYSRTREGRDAHRTDLWIADRDGGDAKQVTTEISSVHSPKWSHDARFIAFAGSPIDGDSFVQLFLYDVERGEARQLGDDDVELASGSSLAWAPDSRAVWFIIARQGLQEIASLSVPDGALTRHVKGERHVMKFALAGERVAFAWVSIRDPNEVFVADPDGGNEQRLTRFNAWWEQCELPRVRLRRMNVPDGRGNHEDIDVWTVLPPNGGDGPFPTLFDKHGGPQSYVLLEYSTQVHWMVLASRGWAIAAANPGGSSSYGQEFARRLRGHWGEMDLPQCLEEVKILQREGTSDDRVAVTGKSYGGYMAAWAITQADVFRAAVVSAPVANMESHFGTSDTGYYVSPYAMKREPQDDRERYRELSPVQHMHKCTTPTLFLQGKDDQRCPLGQSEELFATLMRETTTPAELVMYPGAGHHLAESGKPSQRIDYFTRLVDWVERHANGKRPDTQAARDAKEDARKAEKKKNEEAGTK